MVELSDRFISDTLIRNISSFNNEPYERNDKVIAFAITFLDNATLLLEYPNINDGRKSAAKDIKLIRKRLDKLDDEYRDFCADYAKFHKLDKPFFKVHNPSDYPD